MDWNSDNATYRGQGSYRFNFEQRRSLVLACDVEIVSVGRQPYENFKSNPSNSHYGYAVLFHGSTPFKKVDLEFPATRIFYAKNDLARLTVGQELLSLRIAQAAKIHYDCLSPTIKVCSSLGIGNPEGTVVPGHPETIVKVKTPQDSQFNIVVYWVPVPELGFTNVTIDGSDGSDGLDEYPRPAENTGDNPFEGNPPPSPADPDSDPRDYGGSSGENASGESQVRISWKAYNNPQGSSSTVAQPDIVFVVPGKPLESDVIKGCLETASSSVIGSYCVRPTITVYGVQRWTEYVSVPSDWVTNIDVVYFPQG